MSTTDCIVADTRTGSRVHRATSKRAESAVPLGQATSEQADGAVPAGCCKPDHEQVSSVLLALAGQREADSAGEDGTLVRTVATRTATGFFCTGNSQHLGRQVARPARTFRP